MGAIIVSMVFAFFSGLLYCIYVFANKSEKQFERNAIYTKGIAQGRKILDEGIYEEWYVLINDEYGEEKELLAQPCKPTQYIQPGTVLNVAYMKKKIFGTDFFELRILDERYVKIEKITLAKGIRILSILLGCVAASIAVISLI